jgi:diguanylate cyclase (GGDEF)-like protein
LAVYLPQVDLEQAMRVAERIRKRVLRETNPAITVSCGVAAWLVGEDAISPEQLFYNSDMALYQAKRAGKNQIMTG